MHFLKVGKTAYKCGIPETYCTQFGNSFISGGVPELLTAEPSGKYLITASLPNFQMQKFGGSLMHEGYIYYIVKIS
jgi:hypothetical protein